MPNIYSKSLYNKTPSVMVLKSPQLTISMNRQKPFAVFHTNRSRKILLGDKFPRGLIWSTIRDTCQVESFGQQTLHSS